jgi:hypothetical protein
MSDYQLTSAQMAFMREHHEIIERAYDADRRGQRRESLDMIQELTSSLAYQNLFGDMTWDDAIDRYEDTAGYDSKLRQAFIKDFLDDMEAEKNSHQNEILTEFNLVKLKDILDDE